MSTVFDEVIESRHIVFFGLLVVGGTVGGRAWDDGRTDSKKAFFELSMKRAHLTPKTPPTDGACLARAKEIQGASRHRDSLTLNCRSKQALQNIDLVVLHLSVLN